MTQLAQSDFVHLHVHSDYSLLDGIAKVEKIVKKAKECGQTALALTDHGTLAGSIELWKACTAAGIKPILGCEIYLAFGSMKERKRGYNHLTVLAKNQTGWKNLSRINSLANLEGFYYKPRVDWETLAEHSEGLIILSGCLKGPVPQFLQEEKYDDAKASAIRFREVFADDFYLELQPNSLEEQLVVNEGCLRLSRDLGIKTAATCDLHYLEPKDAAAQEVKICISSGKVLSDKNRLKMKPDFYFRSTEEMVEAFRHVPDAIAATKEIADKVGEYDLLPGNRNEYYLPLFEPPDGSDCDAYFETTCQAGLAERYGTPSEEAKERLSYEMGVIRELGFITYFLIVADFIDWARNNGCAVGPGRGSAAGSIVAYCLGITDVCPLRYDLLFERFLNPSRVSMPDIDVDFCQANRGRVIEYVRNKYGSEKVCQIVTFGTLKPKAVIKDVGRVLEIPFGTVEKISKLIPEGPKLKSLAQAFREVPELQELRDDPAYVKLFDMAFCLEGVNRHQGKHAAGVVIADTDLIERIPLTLVKGDKATEFTMMEVEECGLLKMDFLGLQTLTLIENCLGLIRDRGIEFDLEEAPLDDTATFDMISRGESVGVFQLESSGFRKLLKGAKPDRFEDIIALIALYRPGPLGSKMDEQYIECKHGRRQITYLTPHLEPILSETYGCILYQEQVMRIANLIAGLSMADADNLRKAMGKKKLALMMKYKPAFIDGFKAKDIPEKVAEQVWEQIAFFAEYGFNKSHSAAYGLVTYRTAYLKCHYPAEFMAATLTSWLGATDRILDYTSECERMGITVCPPDVNRSDVKFGVSEGEIVYGLGAIKGMGEAVAGGIVAARKEQETGFRSIFHFCEEVDSRLLTKNVLEALVKAGAFDPLGARRSQYHAVIERAYQIGVESQKDKLNNQTVLFGGVPSADVDKIEEELLPSIEEWPDPELLAYEKEALGFYLSKHPLDAHREVIERYATHQISKLGACRNKSEVTVGGMITAIRHHMTQKGKQMAFVSIEDFTGTTDAVVFPSVYPDVRMLLIPESTVFVQGKVDVEREPPSILVDKLLTSEEAKGKLRVSVQTEVLIEETDESMIKHFREVLLTHRGDDQFYLLFRDKEGNTAGPFRCGSHLRVAGGDELKEALLGFLGPSTQVRIGAVL
ncbi:MAG: DNA polymerase III subunit alpha [Planctomycetes bacterium]|nr:DNA polymerase III subunit alpha [Planctomycetota bacterium]